MNLAERLFDRSAAEGEMENRLCDAGVPFDHIGWDCYDCSLEIHGVPDDYRLSEAAQKIAYDAGFSKVYVNHQDKWETHYSFNLEGFAANKGWRVSYPHNRGLEEKTILVEEFIEGWPKEWFDTGYVVIVAAKQSLQGTIK